MDFTQIETSRDLGVPFGLLLFTYGDDSSQQYGYTDAEQDITVDNIPYKAVPTDRDAVTASGTLDKATIDIRLPQECDVSKLFDDWPPSHVVTLIVKEGHVGCDEFKVRWSGRVMAHKIEGNEAVFTCEPVSTSLRRAGLRRKYGYGCPHVLYGAQCRANKAAHTENLTVQDVSGATVTLPAGWATTDTSKYLNGLVTWTSSDGRLQQRTVLRIVDAENVLLSGLAETLLEGGDLISISHGCNHQMGDCNDLFANIHNFGGQPWIPFKNPIGIANNF